MEVILLQDVKSLGKKGDRVKVNDGYARNYILPRKLGVEANASNLNTLKFQKAHEEKLALELLEQARALANKIESSPITLAVQVGISGKVFGTVSTKEIAREFQAQYGIELDKKKMVIEEPIKNEGTHEVLIKLHKDVTARLKVQVVNKE